MRRWVQVTMATVCVGFVGACVSGDGGPGGDGGDASDAAGQDAPELVPDGSETADGEADAALEVRPDTTPDAVTDAGADIGPDLPPDVEPDADDTDATVEAGRWEALPDLPDILQEHAVVAIAGQIVMVGGFRNLALTADVTAYDPSARTFAVWPALPRALHHVNAAAVEGRLFVLGALEGFAFAAVGDGLVFDPASPETGWTPRAAMPVGRVRGSAGVAVLGGDVYVLGGFRGGAVAQCDVYRVSDDRWERLPDLPAARDHAGAAAIDGKVYLVGGRRGGIASVEAEVWRFDPAQADAGWVAKSPMPTARGGLAVGVAAGFIVAVGGEGNPAVGSGVFPDVERYDPSRDRWERLPPMPSPRHGMQAVGIGEVLYVPGGADVEAFGATKTFEALRFDPRSSR